MSVFTKIDRTPIQNIEYYHNMMQQLDTLEKKLPYQSKKPFRIGFSKVSITPDTVMELAGYGARKPKIFSSVLDSVFIRTIFLTNHTQKVVIVCADLLIIHPFLKQKVRERLSTTHWTSSEIFFTATHTHSSLGQWAPGVLGHLIAGKYSPQVVEILTEKIVEGIQKAQQTTYSSSFSFSELSSEDLVQNRLVGEKGIEDPFQKTLFFETNKGKAIFSSFSAHATCLTIQSHVLSGDFPGYFHQQLSKDTSIAFSLFAAGAVGSMGPQTKEENQYIRTKYLGSELAKRLTKDIKKPVIDSIMLRAFQIPLLLGKPQFKILKNWIIRPYLFRLLFGDETSSISVLQLNNVLLIGMPCDFSGELAMPLYTFAKERGFELIITSFNGGYIGYITEDKWYDLERPETKSMNWYGPETGKYFSQIVKRIITKIQQGEKDKT